MIWQKQRIIWKYTGNMVEADWKYVGTTGN